MVTGRRVYHQTRGFVDHDQRLVFIEDAEINRLRDAGGRFGGWDLATDDISGFHPVAGFPGGCVDPDEPAGDQFGGQRAGEIDDAEGYEGIQALTGLMRLDGEGETSSGCCGA